jgi:hypothetical protein
LVAQISICKIPKSIDKEERFAQVSQLNRCVINTARIFLFMALSVYCQIVSSETIVRLPFHGQWPREEGMSMVLV